MSNYLTRLVERSLGLAPRIEPLIAPLHAPPDQALTERAETSAAFESDRSTATVDTSQPEAPSGVAVNARGFEPAPSHTESQPPRISSPLPVSQVEFPIQKKDDRPHPAESRPTTASSHQTSSAPRVEAVDIIAASPPDPPPSPNATPIVSPGTAQTVVHPETIGPLKPATSPLVPALESSATESPLLPGTTAMASERAAQIGVKPEIISPLKPAASPPVPALESAATEPSLLPGTTMLTSKRTTPVVVQPGSISPLKPAALPSVPGQAPTSKEPPAIHITIGRVEVRAVMPHVAKPKVESPAGPRLSLKDYLKQRNGGRS
jgi:hypothetical protein